MRLVQEHWHSFVCLILMVTAGLKAQAAASPFPEGELRKYAAQHQWELPNIPDSAWGESNESPWVAQSQGRGGTTGAWEWSFTASNGKTSRYKAIVPRDISPAKSYGLLIYLHGDGGYDYNWFYERFAAVARKNGLIPVAILSPTANGNGPSWWWDADRNAVFLDELIRTQLLTRYNIDKEKVIFTGASGGPTFLSGPWIRHFAHQYRGGSINFCGGMVQTHFSSKMGEAFRRNFTLFYYNGTADFLVGGAQMAEAFYRQSGLRVTAEYPAGIGHCGFSGYMDQLMDVRVREILGAASFVKAN